MARTLGLIGCPQMAAVDARFVGAAEREPWPARGQGKFVTT